MIIKLRPKRSFKVPVYAGCISPDVLDGLSEPEVSRLEVWEGNRLKRLGDLFEIVKDEDSGDDESPTIILSGNLAKVRRIGAEMSRGRIVVEGDVGMHLGEGMKGGTIRVIGDAGPWVGCMMRGGLIEIEGSAGDYVGASYRGSREGMKGGTIIIHGDAGSEVGCFMKGGLIKIRGDAGQFVGVHMAGGTILVEGDCGGRAGAEMTDGKIILCGYVPSILPTFTIDDVKSSAKVNGEKIKGPFYRFIGDIAEDGKGRLFVSKPRNPHLNFYEKYL
ncbi:formylmethanofuran dehydrogenase subunit C [Candidatus Bathyarchaeota archaeon]|nr:MAG: formylmethanofuran dehydrogenase subunit C [Candidatus Bathyarchaeota archaeon]RJS79795.1 MAG: formylmethanofuran dehydrogenase subunit C [Candidatus Bathyarchaeota archaeon]